MFDGRIESLPRSVCVDPCLFFCCKLVLVAVKKTQSEEGGRGEWGVGGVSLLQGLQLISAGQMWAPRPWMTGMGRLFHIWEQV